jgi:uncharacterized 2Fe-2S/4Fe-4S cluster protein (DUF4445 family)
MIAKNAILLKRPAASPGRHTLRFPNLDREIQSRDGESVFQAARRNGVRIVGACGGRGSCGACLIRVTEGSVGVYGTRGSAADGDAENEEIYRKWVRSCCVTPQSACTIEIAPRSLAPVVRADVDHPGAGEVLPLDPAVRACGVTVPEATLADNDSDLDRVLRASGQGVSSCDTVAVRKLPGLLRRNAWSVTMRLRGAELIGFAAPGARMLGIAIDLGTTNAAGFLVDLENGQRLASLGIENPQVAWGADLISRINYAIRGEEEAEELRAAAVTAVNALARDLCRAVGASTNDIVDVTVCGNTAMHHLLLGLPVNQLGRAPFVAAVRDAVDIKARDIGLEAAAGAYAHFAPNIGGFVGSDHVMALLAMMERWAGANTSLLMDIGTNTEISLIHEGKILSASCPSGPALEGGHISCGMRAAEGAIERVRIENGRIQVEAIGGKTPVGLCGSGVLDALAVLRRASIIDPGGRLAGIHPDVGQEGGKRFVRMAPGVHLFQQDIRAIQLAKAAVRTSVEMLVREMGIEESQIEQFIVAGAFGTYIDIASGKEIGLFPDLPGERFAQVGNAAGAGIRRMLASSAARDEARRLAARCQYVELSSLGSFQKNFLRNIGFPATGATGKPS